MQFDRTRIVIRQRGIWEILDLSLRIMRIYAKPLLISTMVFGVPLLLINASVLHWILADESSREAISRYVWLMILLVFLETPVATLPTTALLGRAMFLQDLAWRDIAADLWQVVPSILWTQGITRGGLLLVVLMLSMRRSFELSAAEIWLPVLAGYSLLLRLTRPFINEIVLLERNPMRLERADPSRSHVERVHSIGPILAI